VRVPRTESPREIELKYRFENSDVVVAWLDEHYPPADAGGWRTIELTDRYFDTSDLALSSDGHGARLRRLGKEWLVTLKGDVVVDGALHTRVELEAPASAELDPRSWPESAARARLFELVGNRRLIERFVVGQQRRERELALPGALVAVSIDEGEVELLGMTAGQLRQFEAELRSGDAAGLRAFADELAAADLGLVAESRSKLAVAADLAEDAARVAPDDRWADAARKVLRRHLVRMLDREQQTRDGDALALKQMRVATRRMRATWRAFNGAFAGRHASDFEAGLRRVADLLGAVRDLDVLLETVATRPELAVLHESWQTRRDAAFDELVRHLDSRSYERFVRDFMAGTGARAVWAVAKKGQKPVSELATQRLQGELDRMRAAAHEANGSNDSVAWHELRICAKKMRYALEAFRDVLDTDATTDFIEALRTLQDNLGGMNDAAVAAREATAWLSSVAGADAAPTHRVAVVRYIGDAEAFVGKARAQFAEPWAPIVEIQIPPIAEIN